MADTAAMPVTVTTTEVSKASSELGKMRRSLKRWLKFRTVNDGVLAGTVPTKMPLAYAQRHITSKRDMALEQDMADQLHTLLSTVMPTATLPNPDVTANPSAAPQLAQIAINGSTTTAPVATSGLFSAFSVPSHPWLWPVLIVGGVLIVVTTMIKSSADVAQNAEETACIEAGACTDYGFWLKAGGILALSWFAWNALGVGDVVRSYIKPKRRGG